MKVNFRSLLYFGLLFYVCFSANLKSVAVKTVYTGKSSDWKDYPGSKGIFIDIDFS